MSEQKHTPGPWHKRENFVYGISLGCGLIATVHDCADTNKTAAKHARSISVDQGATNTRLIAAAPDLLAACKAAEDFLASSTGHIRIFLPMLNQLSAAIAKATGKEKP